MNWHLVVSGAPRTKKNHGSVIQRGRSRFHIPSAAWTAWTAGATILVNGAPMGLRLARALIATPVNCRALFYRDANRGDAVGYYQGLADLLEKRQVVEDDVLIVSWDGSRLLKDTANPRVELVLEPAAEP